MKISLRKYASALCESIQDGEAGEVTAQKMRNLLKIMAGHKQGKLIKQLPAVFKSLWLKKHNRLEVTAVLALEPSAEEIKNITRLLTGTFKKEVILSTRINPQVIGGMKLIFEDCVIDGTVAANLTGLKRHLTAA